jgi:hypothetical protein
VADEEPALEAALVTPGDGRAWPVARAGVATVLRESGGPSDDASVDVVLRWLCAQVMWPATDAELALGARVLADGLGRAPVDASPPPELPPYAETRTSPPGVGWPG